MGDRCNNPVKMKQIKNKRAAFASSTFVRYCFVGGLGFLVDGGVLYGLVSFALDPFISRGISFPIAVTVTWYFNRNWTFADSSKERSTRQYAFYFAIQIIAALVNLAVYGVVLSHMTVTPGTALIALAFGSFFGLIVNYIGSRVFVFSRQTSHTPHQNIRNG